MMSHQERVIIELARVISQHMFAHPASPNKHACFCSPRAWSVECLVPMIEYLARCVHTAPFLLRRDLGTKFLTRRCCTGP